MPTSILLNHSRLSSPLAVNMSAIPSLPESVMDHGLHNGHAKHDSHVDHIGHSKPNGTSGASKHDAADFTLQDTEVENFRPIKVIVVGAGYSGIYHAIRIPERIKNCELVVYDKNAGVGGTWYENRYPGCACDVPCQYSSCYVPQIPH